MIYGSNTTAFDLVFPDLKAGENTVSCPFHSEKTPSMHINTISKVFNCFGCGVHGSENDFIERYYELDHSQVNTFKKTLFMSESLDDYTKFAVTPGVHNTNYTYTYLKSIGVSEELLADLYVGSETINSVNEEDGSVEIVPNKASTRLVIPIIYKDRVLDLRAYSANPTVSPKCLSKANAPMGLILPHHLWEGDSRPTVICEGEKDMLMARTYGYNAISLGSAKSLPKIMLNKFKGRAVYIVYDNDAAGRSGAIKLASTLYSVTKDIYVADIGKYCTEDKEDVTDFFTKYGFRNEQFDQLLSEAVIFDSTSQELYMKELYPEVSLNEASTLFLGKTVRSNIQVMAAYEDQYSVPSYASLEKTATGGREEYNKRKKGDVEFWTLTKNNFEDVLVLTDNNLKKGQITDNLKHILGWGVEENVKITATNPKTIFKACVSDATESILAKDIKRTEFTCYTDEKLEPGKNYQIIYKVVPHPYKGQQQVLIVLEVKESGDVITSFEVTSEVIKSLNKFQGISFSNLVEMQKDHINFNVDNKLLAFIDLWYHTPKAFNFGKFKNIRGFLDGLIITESRVGKSSTSQGLSKIYNLGAIASLAGSAATSAGLIGGSVKSGTSSQIRPGLIPRNHEKAIIFEELAKSKYSLMSELTDVRSSGMVRINRSTGDLTLPASVRMLFLTNPKTEDSTLMRSIMSYPNGIEIVKPLIGSIEDIARFDFIYILGENPKSIDPLWEADKGFDEKDLRTRINWVWSRTPDQIILSKEIQKYIVEWSRMLNSKYECSLKIFSTETWKKVARLAIAIAGYKVSTDAEFNNIIIKEEHVKTACTLLTKIYDNPIFRLSEFVVEERKRTECSTKDINELLTIYQRFPSLMNYLENNNNISKSELMTISGLDIIIFQDVLQRLANNSFITLTRDKIFPTPKILTAIKKVKLEHVAMKPEE